MDWTKLSVGISLVWIILLISRMAIYAAPFASTPNGQLFVAALNIFLIIGILVVGYSLFRQLFRYTAAKTMKGTHCPQCYSKVGREEEFCPRCGCRLDHRRLQRKYLRCGPMPMWVMIPSSSILRRTLRT